MTGKKWLLRLAAPLAVAVVAIGAVGCGGDDEGDGGEATSDVSVAFVSDTGGVNDRGFNEFTLAGVEQAADELGLEMRTYISKTEDDYVPNLTAAAEDHDLVVATGFLITPSVVEVAAEFPDTSFMGVDHFYGGEGCEKAGTCALPNAMGLIYPSEEPGYLAGIVAGMMTESNTVSSVGGIKIPSVDNWIAGYQFGVKEVNPDAKTLNAYSASFTDQAKCNEIALDQISQGADVIFQVAGDCGLAAIDAACEAGKFAIGVDADQAEQGECVVTSGLKPLQSSVFTTIENFTKGEFQGGQNVTFGVADLPDAELLAPFSDDVPQEVQDAVADGLEKLKSGEVDPPSTLG